MYEVEICLDLNRMGIGHQYLGYNAAVVAISMVVEDESRLNCLKNNLLAPMSRQFNTPADNIVRNIRTIIARAWQTNRPYLCKLAGYELQQPPSATEFIDIIATSILRAHPQHMCTQLFPHASPSDEDH